MTKKQDAQKNIILCLDRIKERFKGLEIEFEYLDKHLKWDLFDKYNLHKMVSYTRLQSKEVRILTEKVSK